MRNIMIGIVIGALLVVSGTAFAEEVQSWIGKTIEGQFPISVDGERVSQPGLVIEGSSYLPVRAAGELFGYDVSFVDSEVILDKKETESREGGSEVGLMKNYENLTDQELIKEYDKWKNSLDILPDNLSSNAKEITNAQIQEIERIMLERGIDPDGNAPGLSLIPDEHLRNSIEYLRERVETNEKVIEELQKRGDRQHNIDSIREQTAKYKAEISEKQEELERRGHSK